jgi:hypothetical protein
MEAQSRFANSFQHSFKKTLTAHLPTLINKEPKLLIRELELGGVSSSSKLQQA